jgi:ABC-type polysaccharide/polyol phosphate transport system ATPase subunit
MSSEEVAIRVRDLSKCYQIYNRPADRLKQFIVPRVQRLIGGRPSTYFNDFWALSKVSFEVKKGETVGVIGRNGSGKSTLLQIVCGTLNPTSGDVQVNGRIAALLELGAGFNPEFTGRENVHMNGALLGLSAEQIDSRFADIAKFAEIGSFIEQPVKTYSSGMFVRLAFAVAVHTDPAILIVDEALSVGDIAFQNKCMQKIKDLKERGTSILFVSHDLSTVQIVCDRVIWLQQGQLMQQGDAVSVCQEYYVASVGTAGPSGIANAMTIRQQQTGMAEFRSLRLIDSGGTERQSFSVGEDIRFEFELAASAALEETVFAVSIYRADGEWMIGQTSREHRVFWRGVRAGGVMAGSLVLTANCLAPGDYLVALGAYSRDHSTCYALTDLTASFAVRSSYQTWGKFIHPCRWIDTNGAVAHE